MTEKNTPLFTKLFLVITFVIGYVLSIIFMLQKAVGALAIVMFIPGLTAAVFTYVEQHSFKALFAPFKKKITLKSVLFTFLYPLVIIASCALLALVTKQGTLSKDWTSILMNTLPLILLSVPSFFLGLSEEYGWRGYLLPRLAKRHGLLGATWRVGIIWALFHFPTLLIINLQFGIMNALVFTAIQLVTIFMFNFGFSYLFLLSQNIFLPSVMHILWNNVNVKILGDTYRATSDGMILGDIHIINGECFFGLIFMALLAVLMVRRLHKAAPFENNQPCNQKVI